MSMPSCTVPALRGSPKSSANATNPFTGQRIAAVTSAAPSPLARSAATVTFTLS